VTATSYQTGTAMSFFEGAADIKPWTRSTRIGVHERLTTAHVLASSAIPMFFPPVEIAGHWYGDGCVRLSDPLSPAIHLGAERLVAIGIRYARTPQETDALNRSAPRKSRSPAISEISGVMLNAIFLDSLDADAERLERINAMLSLVPLSARTTMRNPLRAIPLLVLRPSRDLGSLAVEQYSSFPRTLRHLLRGIGATGDSGWDLVSYLAFEPAYVERLMDLGYEDTYARRDEVTAFFEREGPF
jgi:NTE family protein